MMSEPLHEDLDRVFLRHDSAGTNAAIWLAGGVLALGGAAVGFAVSLFGKVDMLTLQAVTTLPALLGLGALTAAWSFARTPRQVAVGPRGVTIEQRSGTRVYGWDEIGWANVVAGALNQRRQLVLFDNRGKAMATLSEAFGDFDALVEIVMQRISRKTDDTSEQIRSRKSRRSAVVFGAFSVLMLCAAGGMAWMTHREQRALRLLAEDAVPGEAQIVRRFLAPNGVTPRLEYRVTAPGGRTGMRNAEVERPIWDGLEGATTVPVFYVPREPDISRLAIGEVEEKDLTRNPVIAYGLSVVVALMCFVFLGVAALQWHGWDLDLDSKTGRLSVKRFGTGR
ncbi:MAG: hypothetical protein HUU20_10495 [Pirellulales bacterium]|nr:hypothetical protein [Pirellulales bacterium]